jgi:hypothetical protein
MKHNQQTRDRICQIFCALINSGFDCSLQEFLHDAESFAIMIDNLETPKKEDSK